MTNSTEAEQRKLIELVRSAVAVAETWKYSITMDKWKVDDLEEALIPFTRFRRCGHWLLEECDCPKLNRIKRKGNQ